MENLYFHHYRTRASPRAAQKTEKGAASISLQGSSESPAAATSATPALVVKTLPVDQQQQQPPSDTATAPVERDASRMEVDSLHDQNCPNPPQTEQTPSDVSATQSQPPVPASPAVALSNPLPSAIPKTPSPRKPPRSLQPSPIPHSPTHTSQSPTPSAAIRPSVSRTLPLTRHPTQPPSVSPTLRSGGPSPAMKSHHSAPSSAMSGSSNVALTYDSFWSSHSTTSTNYRSALTGTPSYESLDESSSNPGLPNLEADYAFSVTAPSPPFEPLQKQRTLARKTAVAALQQSYSRTAGGG